MQNTRSKNTSRTAPSRLSRWTVALAATLLVAPQVLAAQQAAPAPAPRPAQSPAAAGRPAAGRPVAVAPQAPEPEDAQEPEEAPEPPEPAFAPMGPMFGDDLDVNLMDLNLDLMKLNVDLGDVNLNWARGPVIAPNFRFQVPPVPPIPPMPAGAWGQFGRGYEDAMGWQSNQHFDNVENEKDPARKTYLEGRNFAADSEWSKAAAKFNEVVTKYQGNKVADAALYWYAYALKKNGSYQDAWNATERFVRDFPKSRYADDVQALQNEIAPIIGKVPPNPTVAQQNDDETKAYVIMSLMQSDPSKGIVIATDILKPESKASPRLKQQVVIMLVQTDDERAVDVLLNVVRTEQDQRVKKQAVIMLGQRLDDPKKGDAIFNELKRLAMSNDPELAKIAVVALSQDDGQKSLQQLVELATSAQSMEVRKMAVIHLAQRDDATACQALIRVYDNTKEDEELRRMAVVALAQSDCPQAADKLMDVARNAESVELRRFALLQLVQKDSSKATQILTQMYDSEKNETIKEGIINALGQAVDDGKNKDALRKLMSIAKSDPSLEMRKKAIFWIGQSKDPEATQFLVDLLSK